MNDPKLVRGISTNLMCLVAICEIETRIALCTHKLNMIHTIAEGKTNDELLAIILRELESNIKINQTGFIDRGKIICDVGYDWMVIEHKTDAESIFLLADIRQHIIYDPMNGSGWKNKGIKKICLYKGDSRL